MACSYSGHTKLLYTVSHFPYSPQTNTLRQYPNWPHQLLPTHHWIHEFQTFSLTHSTLTTRSLYSVNKLPILNQSFHKEKTETSISCKLLSPNWLTSFALRNIDSASSITFHFRAWCFGMGLTSFFIFCIKCLLIFKIKVITAELLRLW